MERPVFRWKRLLFLIMVTMSLRFCWILTRTAVIENEGGEYARLAENLLGGRGYVGNMGQPQLTYAPLFPILIALATWVCGNSEVAGRCVSLLLGTLLVVPVYLIAHQLYGRTTALIAGLLVAFHPLLIGYSSAVYNETVYLTLLMLGVYWGLRCITDNDWKHSVFAGTCFGLGYLSRVEAVAIVVLTVLSCGILGWAQGIMWKKLLYRNLLILGTFAVIAAPYVGFLSGHTGRFRFEAKNKMNFTIGSRINSGLSVDEAQLGISSDLKDEGPLLDENRFVDYSPFPVSLKTMTRYFLKSALRNRHTIYQRVINHFFLGSPILMLFAAHFVQFRYLLPLVPFLIIWAAQGVTCLREWFRGSLALMKCPWRLAVIEKAIPAVAMLALLAVAGFGVLNDGVQELDSGGRKALPLKQAGLWLKQYAQGSKKIMDTRTIVPYYSGGTLVYLPETDSVRALRYIDSRNPDFIVLTDFSFRRTYLTEWLQHSIPSPKAELIYTTGLASSENRVAIYRWNHSVAPRTQEPRC